MAEADEDEVVVVSVTLIKTLCLVSIILLSLLSLATLVQPHLSDCQQQRQHRRLQASMMLLIQCINVVGEPCVPMYARVAMPTVTVCSTLSTRRSPVAMRSKRRSISPGPTAQGFVRRWNAPSGQRCLTISTRTETVCCSVQSLNPR